MGKLKANIAKPVMRSIPGEISTNSLTALLNGILAESPVENQLIQSLQRRVSDYSSSFQIEELDASLTNHLTLKLMFKDLSWRSLLDDARRARPEFLYDPRREILVYQNILSKENLGTAAYFGSHIDADHGQYLLFLERVNAPKLCHTGDFSIWEKTAQWLSEFHLTFQSRIDTMIPRCRLLNFDAAYYRVWMHRAKSFYRQANAKTCRESRDFVNWLSVRYEQVVERLSALPHTMIHGEFYASNILAERSANSVRICPVDWELASSGPGLFDLAALVAGSWKEPDRLKLITAYYNAIPSHSRTSFDEFCHLLNFARLHLAVQYIGWATEWSPPSDQQFDWIKEAQTLSATLNL